jgi:multidrug resistance protein
MKKNRRIATWVSLALLPLSGFATDIYIPSLPFMAQSLHVSSLQVQVTISLFLVSYGVSQLFIGSILDSYGRYRIGLVSLILFTLASLVMGLTHQLSILYAMRIVQGVTTAGIIAGKRAYFVDVFKGDQLKSYLSLFTIIWSTGPIIAPFVGGWLQKMFGWETNFYFLALLGAGFLVAEFLFNEETLAQPRPFQLRRVVSVYAEMLRTRDFVLGILLLGLAYSMVMVYNLTGSFIIEHHFQYSEVTAGYCSLILGFAWMTGGFISKGTIRWPFFRKLAINTGVQVAVAVLMLASAAQAESIYSLVIFAFLIHVGAGFMFNNYLTACLTQFPQNAGVASGLTGGFNFVIVSVLSYGLVNFLPAKDELNLAYSYVVFTLLTVFVLVLAFRERAVRSSVKEMPA